MLNSTRRAAQASCHGRVHGTISRSQWNLVESNGIRWNPMEPDGTQWNPMESDGIQWNRPDGIQWNPLESTPMESNGIQWNPMEFSGTQCILFIPRIHGLVVDSALIPR